jgi:hypothetical protein
MPGVKHTQNAKHLSDEAHRRMPGAEHTLTAKHQHQHRHQTPVCCCHTPAD